MKRPVLLIIGDGMTDIAYSELNGKTPLEIASTPTLDKLAEEGICGMLYPVGQGKTPSSPAAHRGLMGDDYNVPVGRGLFSALSSGMEMKEGEIAFRCDLSTVKNGIVVDERAGRIKETDEIEEAINQLSPIDDIQFRYRALHEYRGVLIINSKTEELNDEVTDLFALENTRLFKAKAKDNSSLKVANFMNSFFEKVSEMLKNHPVNLEREKRGLPVANSITLRGASKLKQSSSIVQRNNIRAACVAAIPDVIGALKYCGLTPLDVSEDIKDLKVINPQLYIDPILKNINKYDFFVINIGGFDEAGHDGDIYKKIHLFEQLDEVVKYWKGYVGDKAITILTADHSTLCQTRQHSYHPVPVCVNGEGVGKDAITSFSELQCVHGSLGFLNDSRDLANIISFYLGFPVYIP